LPTLGFMDRAGSGAPYPGSPAAAYRRHLAESRGSSVGGPELDDWLMVATILHHVAMGPGSGRAALLDAAQTLAANALGEDAIRAGCALDPAADEPTRPATLFRVLAERIEEAGVLHVAANLLEIVQHALAPSSLDVGRILAQRARIAWKLGDVELATDRYDTVARLAQSVGSAELRVRAWIGYMGLARHRGNFPESRKWGSAALVDAEQEGFVRLAGLAHHGMMIVEAVGHNFDAALVHGWHAFLAARGDREAEADALVNLSQYLLEIGYPAAARAGFGSILVAQPAPRRALPAVGGFAIASARLGDDATVRQVAARLVATVGDASFPYERATALLECGLALSAVGGRREAEQLYSQALRIAESRGYHEICHRAEAATAAHGRSALACVQPLGELGESVASEIAALDPGLVADRELLAALRT